MGIIWRFAMPLLSTLAALVIIVHTAEEDMEAEYRRGLKPRVLDPGTPQYDQPWRSMEAEQIVNPTQSPHWGDNSSEELPKRRRPVRKRKRRPQLSAEDQVSQERYTYPEEPSRPFFEVDYGRNRQTTDIPRRRRKNSMTIPNRWTEDPLKADRPLRRRGLRRKRPSLEMWPVLSEFGGYQRNHTEPEIYTEANQEYIDPMGQKELSMDDPMEEEIRITTTDSYQPELYDVIEDGELPRGQMKEDKSLSEFSFELMNLNEEDSKADIAKLSEKTQGELSGNNNYVNKAQDKNNKIQLEDDNIIDDLYIDSSAEIGMLKNTANELKAQEKAFNIEITKLLEDTKSTIGINKGREKNRLLRLVLQESISLNADAGPIDPVTLREILKRSNGTSLSEILQQHNLSLGDLIHGRGNALKVLKSKDIFKINPQDPFETKHDIDVNTGEKENTEEKLLINSDKKYVSEPNTKYSVITEDYQELEKQTTSNDNVKPLTIKETPVYRQTLNSSLPRIVTKRRFSGVIRRKQRIRPLMNDTLQEEIRKDLMALNARKYIYHNRRNPTINSIKTSENVTTKNENDTVTMASILEETTTLPEFDNRNNNVSELEIDPHTNTQSKNINDSEIINMDVTEVSIVSTKNIENYIKITETLGETFTTRPLNASTLRRQAFNNRLKKKRLKKKNTTTESPQDDILRSLYGMGNLVSSSDFIARTQTPKSVAEEYLESETTLEDFILTTETPKKYNRSRTIRPLVRYSTISELPDIMITTEETAKIEIEEILNDTLTSAKLSQILMERNMTVSELVQHRERGSSHVHLADIFHNASKEPNPAEPFLSKSLIEPISREIYPLRALLDANSHDPTGKATTIDPNFVNSKISVVMDFGNNVNENAENMGIMSLFNNFTNSEVIPKNNTLKQVSEGTPYKISSSNLNDTHTVDANDTAREGRVLEDSNDDVVSWNEIFTLMRKNHRNETEDIAQTISEKLLPMKTSKKPTLEVDVDGDGLIVLEDLQHLKDFDNNIATASDEKFEVNSNTYDKTNIPSPTQIPDILEKNPSNTKSVTVATASIAGLAMVLFLLTYGAFKWKQQQTFNRKKRSFCDERIPTPVFENRKGHKNNSSTRSISPMLSSSNIYTLNTLDSHNGKESPDYMWDTLRKPFQ